MGFIKDTVNQIFDASTGKTSTSTLQTWLNTFSSNKDSMITTPDPLATFDVTIEFWPRPFDFKKKELGKGQKIGQILSAKLKEAGSNLLKNITLGLVGQEMAPDIMKSHDEFQSRRLLQGQTTFMDYLAKSNMFPNNDQLYELNLGPYIQQMTIPSVTVVQDEVSDTMMGKFPLNGSLVLPDSNEIQMTLINTQAPLHERIFYPWMREVTLPYWSYDSQPYTTAKITVDFTKHSDIKYVFCGCRPTKIFTQQPTQDVSTSAITREVVMLFDYMFITSDLKTKPSSSEKLIGAGQTLFNSVANTFNL